MSDFSLTLVLQFKTSKIINDMAKVQIKSERVTPFGGMFHVRELFSRYMAPIIDKVLGLRCASYGYQYSEIVGSLSSVYFWEHFYIRANRSGSLYDCMLALRGWQREEINGNEYELNSIITEKWEGKAYRLVIQRERRMGGELDLWEGGYTYRCILTNDYSPLRGKSWNSTTSEVAKNVSSTT